jgi:plasmid stabilization system protein ParE
MAKKIVWTNNAKADFFKILSYLQNTWSLKIADNFSKIVERKVELLSQFPELGARSQKFRRRRKITLTSQSILIYTITGENLVLLSIFDSRRNPADAGF